MPRRPDWRIVASMRIVRIGASILLIGLSAFVSDSQPSPLLLRAATAVDNPCTPEADWVVRLMGVDYPPEFLSNETEGSARIEITFGASGVVTGARGISGLPNFVNAALKAANKWTLVPMIDNLQHPLSMDVDVNFRIVPPQLDPATFPEATNPNSFVATMERQGCYGRCPVYRLKVHGDGLVEYEGDAYVLFKGRHRARIAPANVDQLLADFRNANYFALDDKYVELRKSTEILVTAGGCTKKLSQTHIGMATDLSSTVTTLTIGDKTKKVLDYYGAPASLRQLENKIDELTHSDKWVRGTRNPIAR